MSVFVRDLLNKSQLTTEEETFGPLERLEITQEGLEITHQTDLAIAQYDAIVESARSLEALSSLAHENPTSLESLAVPFEVASSGHLKGDLSLEGISSFLKSVWDAIVKAWNKLVEMMGKLIDWVLGRGGKQQEQSLSDLKKETDALILSHNKSLVNQQARIDESIKGCQKTFDAIDKVYADMMKDPDFAAFDAEYNRIMDEAFGAIPEPVEKDMGKAEEVPVSKRAEAVGKVAKSNEELAKVLKKTSEKRSSLQKVVEKKLKNSDPENESDFAKKLRGAFGNELSKPAKVLQESTKHVNAEIVDMEKARSKKKEKVEA